MLWFVVSFLFCASSFAKEHSILDQNQLNEVMNELKLLRKEVEENRHELKAVKLELEESKRHRTCQCDPNSAGTKSESEINELRSSDIIGTNPVSDPSKISKS